VRAHNGDPPDVELALHLGHNFGNSAGGGDLVVDDNHVLVANVPHDPGDRHVVVAQAIFLPCRHRHIQGLGEFPCALGMSDVRCHEHRVAQILLAEVLQEHRVRRQVVGRHREEAVHLWRVQRHRDDLRRAGSN